jgi:hypothetical protein
MSATHWAGGTNAVAVESTATHISSDTVQVELRTSKRSYKGRRACWLLLVGSALYGWHGLNDQASKQAPVPLPLALREEQPFVWCLKRVMCMRG